MNSDVRCNFTIRRKMGDDEIEIGMSSLASPGEAEFEMNRLMGFARSAMHDYMNNVAPTLPHNPRDTQGYSPDAWYPVEKLIVTIDKGKRYVKALAGKWEKHGVVIWPEVAEKIGFDLASIPLEGYIPAKTLEACITENGDKKARLHALRIKE